MGTKWKLGARVEVFSRTGLSIISLTKYFVDIGYK
jgi:hypothetical protein